MKKLYIHIGRAKTGTTALQNFMAANAGPLAAYGVKYADTGRFYTTHHPLAWSLHREANESCGGRYWPRASRYARLEMEPAEYWAAMLREMNTSDHEAFVVSSEEFGVVLDLHLTAPLLARHLKGVEVYIVVYFRRQDEFLQSVYNQAVKGEEDRFTGSFWDYVNPILEVGGADCMKVVSPLAKAFGEDRIIVRVYEKEQLKATIFDDFLSVFGIESGDGFTQIERVQNPRLSPELLSVIRKMNRIPMAATVRHRLLGMLIERYPRTRTFSSHGVLSPVNRLQLLERFRESNAKVARTYLGRADGRLFLAPEPDPNEPFREVAFSTEEALDTVTDLWAEYAFLQRVNDKEETQLVQERNVWSEKKQ